MGLFRWWSVRGRVRRIVNRNSLQVTKVVLADVLFRLEAPDAQAQWAAVQAECLLLKAQLGREEDLYDCW